MGGMLAEASAVKKGVCVIFDICLVEGLFCE